MLIKSCDKHYYDEDNIEVGTPPNCRITVNHTVELTAEEKEESRKEALQRATNEAYSKMTKQPKKSGITPEVNKTPNLFNF